MELVLEWDWHALIRRLKHSSSEWQWHWHNTDDVTGINITQLTDNTNCWPTLPVVLSFTGGPSVLQQIEPLHIYKDSSPHSILMARLGRQAPTTSQLQWLDTSHNSYWLLHCKRIWCRVCSAKYKGTRMKFKCWEGNITFCAIPCFEVYHTKLHFSRSADTKVEKWNTNVSKYYHWNYWTDIFQ